MGPSADYVVLSPDIGLDQLAERTFDAGVGYLARAEHTRIRREELEARTARLLGER